MTDKAWKFYAQFCASACRHASYYSVCIKFTNLFNTRSETALSLQRGRERTGNASQICPHASMNILSYRTQFYVGAGWSCSLTYAACWATCVRLPTGKGKNPDWPGDPSSLL